MILLTGASGFVGRAVLSRAGTGGAPCRTVGRKPLPESRDHHVVASYAPENLAPAAFAGIGAVIHCAAQAHVAPPRTADERARFIRATAEETAALARHAQAHGIRRFVFVSSIKAVGERSDTTPLSPASPCRPEDMYGEAKAATEQALATVAAEGLDVAIIRPCLVYGPGAKGNLARLMSALTRQSVWPVGAIRNRRSMVSVTALAELLLTVASTPEPASGVWHAADRDPVSTPTLLRALANGLGRPLHAVPVPPAALTAAATLVGRRELADRLTGSLEVDASATVAPFGWAQVSDPVPGLIAMARAFRA